MPILMIMDIEGATAEQYDGVDELLGGLTPENAPPGLISHAAAITDSGVLVADVWESAEDLQRFFDEKLGAAIAQAGVPRRSRGSCRCTTTSRAAARRQEHWY